MKQDIILVKTCLYQIENKMLKDENKVFQICFGVIFATKPPGLGLTKVVDFFVYISWIFYWVRCYTCTFFNPLPHGVLATFFPTAGGLIGPHKKDISREKTILMTSLQTHRASAVRREGLHYTCPSPPPSPLKSHCVHCLEPDHNFLRIETILFCIVLWRLKIYNL